MTAIRGVRTGRLRTRSGPRLHAPAQLPWLLPLLVLATVFFLWPVVNVIRLAFTVSTLLRGSSSEGVEKCSEGRTSSVSMSKSGW